MAVREKAAEVVPFVVMVIMEGCTIALTIWAKTVMTDHGMSPFVFVVYTNSLTSLILLPYSLIFHRHTRSIGPTGATHLLVFIHSCAYSLVTALKSLHWCCFL